MNGLTQILAEAKRRRVFRTIGVYLVAVWGLSQGGIELAPLFGVPVSFIRTFVIAAIASLPIVAVLAWMFELGRTGIVRDSQDKPAQQTHESELARMTTRVGVSGGPGSVIVRWEEAGGEKASIFSEDFFIGRGEGCGVRFYDLTVSRKHARVYRDADTWYIEDLGSQNGTLIDEKRIERSSLSVFSEVWINEVGPSLRLELVSSGAETRAAMSAFALEQSTAHVRHPALGVVGHDRSKISEK